jgi:hypothetical protein
MDVLFALARKKLIQSWEVGTILRKKWISNVADDDLNLHLKLRAIFFHFQVILMSNIPKISHSYDK